LTQVADAAKSGSNFLQYQTHTSESTTTDKKAEVSIVIRAKNLETATSAASTDRRSNNTKRSLYLQKQLELTTK
jgi:hypothetical protein